MQLDRLPESQRPQRGRRWPTEVLRFGPGGEVAYEDWETGRKAWSPEHGDGLVAANDEVPWGTTAEFTSDGQFLMFTPVDFDDLLGVYAWNLVEDTLAALKLGQPMLDSFVLEPEQGVVLVPGRRSCDTTSTAAGKAKPSSRRAALCCAARARRRSRSQAGAAERRASTRCP
ncbi:hypothetical protein WME73_37460 [Sorangium sp. So ce302]|uniref:hypothetical protein n=1 Tax=Sorangium sp. So ce302 TaxID=3133297 RepID=UPI003F634968